MSTLNGNHRNSSPAFPFVNSGKAGSSGGGGSGGGSGSHQDAYDVNVILNALVQQLDSTSFLPTEWLALRDFFAASTALIDQKLSSLTPSPRSPVSPLTDQSPKRATKGTAFPNESGRLSPGRSRVRESRLKQLERDSLASVKLRNSPTQELTCQRSNSDNAVVAGKKKDERKNERITKYLLTAQVLIIHSEHSTGFSGNTVEEFTYPFLSLSTTPLLGSNVLIHKFAFPKPASPRQPPSESSSSTATSSSPVSGGPTSEGAISPVLMSDHLTMTPLEYSRRSVAYTVLEIVRARYIAKKYSSQRSLSPDSCTQDDSTYGDLILRLCEDASETFMQDSLFLQIRSPLYVMGDLHGSSHDLAFFLKNLVNFETFSFTPNCVLFLGDYVDRGEASIEVICALFALKVLAPPRCFLLRGNHETIECNRDEARYGSASFFAQCKQRFGVEHGTEIHRAINRVFALLPLAAVIDNRIFCVHGGIPRPMNGETYTSCLQMLNSPDFPRRESWSTYLAPSPPIPPTSSVGIEISPRRLENSPRQHHSSHHHSSGGSGGGGSSSGSHHRHHHSSSSSGSSSPRLGTDERLALLVLGMLWSDPAHHSQAPLLDSAGFGRNSKRGGSYTYVWGRKAMNDFFRETGYEYIIRAHEVVQQGLRLCHGSRVITVFTSSSYSGGDNCAGSVFITEGKLRLISVFPLQPPTRVSSVNSNPTTSPPVLKPEHLKSTEDRDEEESEDLVGPLSDNSVSSTAESSSAEGKDNKHGSGSKDSPAGVESSGKGGKGTPRNVNSPTTASIPPSSSTATTTAAAAVAGGGGGGLGSTPSGIRQRGSSAGDSDSNPIPKCMDWDDGCNNQYFSPTDSPRSCYLAGTASHPPPNLDVPLLADLDEPPIPVGQPGGGMGNGSDRSSHHSHSESNLEDEPRDLVEYDLTEDRDYEYDLSGHPFHTHPVSLNLDELYKLHMGSS